MPHARITEDDGVLLITLDRPDALNAISLEMSELVGEAMQRAEDDSAIRAVVLTSSLDKAFSAGADLKATSNGEPSFDREGSYGSWGLAGSTERTPGVPVIAAVEGLALGGGFEMCLAADILVASEKASFGLPEVTVGLMAGAGGAVRLPGQLPRKVAMDLLLTGRRLPADEAHRLGLVSRLVAAGEAWGTATEIARTIAANAPLAVRATKATALDLVDGVEQAERAGWDRNHEEFATVLASEDAAEGAAAFRDKRRPLWSGR